MNTRYDMIFNNIAGRKIMRYTIGRDILKIHLEGRIDSGNAEEHQKAIFDLIRANEDLQLVFDARDLNYISSAGLRVLLKARKTKGEKLKIENVSDSVLEILTVTGFSDLFDITKKRRTVFLERSDALSRSINGAIYKQSDDNILKVFRKDVSLREIEKERASAHTALVLGVPTLIPFDVVDVGNNYGIIFESAGAVPLSKMITAHPDKLEYYADRFASFLHELHEITITDEFPNIKDLYREWIIKGGNRLSDSDRRGIEALLNGIPDSNGYLHGDINPSNVVISDDEFMLMDMAGSSHGHPIFDLQVLYASLIEIEKERPMYCSSTFGLSAENCVRFWEAFLPAYMKGSSESEINSMKLLLSRYYVLKKKLLAVLEEG